MSETLAQSSDATWPAAKEAARAAVRRAGQTLLALAIERAVSRAENVLASVEARASDPPAEAAGSPVQEADPPGQEAVPPTKAARAALAATSQSAGGRAQDDRRHSGDEAGHITVRGVLSDLLKAGLQLAMNFVERLTDRLEDIVAGGGVLPAAGLGAGIAALVGRNPIWGAIKGAFSALSPGAKVALIVALVLAAILLPVTVLLLLIVLIIVVVVLAVRTRARQS